MTASTLERERSASRLPAPPPRRQAGRVSIIICLIVSLLCAGGLREIAAAWQARSAVRGEAASRSTLGNMNSFALALLLGGLRGPLVMFLWSTSESQKADKDLEDFDTKLEWIRLLQPEFDTVHMFQIWNKAYNISVLMASPANKYVTIMQAIDYANSVDEERPGDINILNSISGVYSGKLGATTLSEAPFYNKQFREESMTPEARKAAYPDDKSFRRLSTMKPLLNDDNTLSRVMLVPTRPPPANRSGDSEWNDGSQLQYLKAYEPFPHGLSPEAMSYNYAKRAQVAMTVEGQSPLQVSSMVIDSRPALQLKAWAEEEAKRGRIFEAKAFGMLSPAVSPEAAQVVAKLKPDQKVVDPAAHKAAVQSFALAARLCGDSINEYHRHLSHPDYTNRYQTYQSHLDDMTALGLVSAADRDYDAAFVATGPERDRLLASAKALYYKAAIRFERTVLEYYVEDQVMAATFPPKYSNRIDVVKLPEDQVEPTFAAAMKMAETLPHQEYSDERGEYNRTLERCYARMAEIK